MKKLLLILLCLPMIGFGQSFDFNKLGIGIQANFPYIVGPGISYSATENNIYSLYFDFFDIGSSSGGFYFEYNKLINKEIKSVITIQPLYYILLGYTDNEYGQYLHPAGKKEPPFIDKLGCSAGVGVEAFHKNFKEIKLNLKVGLGKNPTWFDVSLINISSGLHYYF